MQVTTNSCWPLPRIASGPSRGASSRLPKSPRLLREGLVDDPPAVAKGSRGANETGYIRDGFRFGTRRTPRGRAQGPGLDCGLREPASVERTGIQTLKIRFHPVHGYAIEVTKDPSLSRARRLRAKADARQCGAFYDT